MSAEDNRPPEEVEKIEYESIKTRIDDVIPKGVLADFIRNVVKCPTCASPLDLRPVVEAAVVASLEEMVRLNNVQPRPAIPTVILCLPCKKRGVSTAFPIQN
jgi:hypothetical protein